MINRLIQLPILKLNGHCLSASLISNFKSAPAKTKNKIYRNILNALVKKSKAKTIWYLYVLLSGYTFEKKKKTTKGKNDSKNY